MQKEHYRNVNKILSLMFSENIVNFYLLNLSLYVFIYKCHLFPEAAA